MPWAVLFIVGIAVAVWLLSTIFGGNQTPPPKAAPPRRRPERFGDAPQRRPIPRVERTAEEVRRGAAPPRQPRVARPAPRQPIVLEEVIEAPPPPTSLQATRAGYTPTQSPSKAPIEKSLPAPVAREAAQPVAPPTSLQATRADYMPTQSPSQAPGAEFAKPLPVLRQVRLLLRSPQSAATAFVLREIDAPRCRRPR